MLPFAKGVSAKTYDFDDQGNQPMMDYGKLMDIVKSSGFKGYIGIEYEGFNDNEEEGIRKTMKTLTAIYLMIRNCDSFRLRINTGQIFSFVPYYLCIIL